MIPCANTQALSAHQAAFERLPVDADPSPSEISAVKRAALVECASRQRADRSFLLACLRDMTAKPGTKFADAAASYDAAMGLLARVIDDTRTGKPQTADNLLLGTYLVGCLQASQMVAAEHAGDLLAGGKSHRDAVAQALDWVEGATEHQPVTTADFDEVAHRR